MKLRNLTFAGLTAVLLFSCGGEAKQDEKVEDTPAEEVILSYNADLSGSEVNWKGQAIGGLYYHTGVLKLSEGNITTTNGKVSGGNFTIDWNSNAVTDSNYSEEHPSKMLLGHLSSADFFAFDSLGAAKFEITGVEGSDIIGKLTIRGISNDEKITNVVMTEENGMISATGDLVFDRQKYDVKFAMTGKDMVLSDDIETTITFKGNANM